MESKVKCPRCKTTITITPGEDMQLEARCPSCGHEFSLQLPADESKKKGRLDGVTKKISAARSILAERRRNEVEQEAKYKAERAEYDAKWVTPPMTDGGNTLVVTGLVLAFLAFFVGFVTGGYGWVAIPAGLFISMIGGLYRQIPRPPRL